MTKHLRLEIAELRREHYGHSSERHARLIDQMELQLEELEATATESRNRPHLPRSCFACPGRPDHSDQDQNS